MPQFADRVKTTSTSTGSSAITLSSSGATGYQAFPSSLDGETVGYVIEASGGTDWEIGTGVYTHSSLNLTRSLRSSSTGSLLNLGSGTHTVFLTPAAQDIQIVEAFSSTSDLPSASASHGRIYHVHGEGAMYFAHSGSWVKLANYSDITTYTHPNHSGEVTSTGDGATVIADNVVDEANLKVSNSPTDGYVLTARSGNTGGMTWEAVSGGGGSSTSALTETTFSATANQTAFPVSGGITNASNVSVFQNGVKLEEGASKDYTASASTNTVTLNSGAAAGDVVEVLEYGQPASSGSGVTTYTAKSGTDGTPSGATYIDNASSPSEGDLAYDLAADQLYIRTTSAWTRLASGVDETPIITTEPATTHTLNDDGSTSTVTMVAEDPEGFDITYGIAYPTANNALPNQLATATSINQSTGVFTFDPSTNSAHAGDVKVRLSASDGARTTTRFCTLSLAFPVTVDYLVVAGGGAGGVRHAGGGGAGGLIYATSQSLNAATAYTITVGTGGAIGSSQNDAGGSGADSSISGSGFTTVTAIGGGGGAGSNSSSPAQNGGSGGGGSYPASTAGTGTSGQGNNGGAGASSANYHGGGGGGSGGAGSSFSSSGGGNGGAGTQNSITGTALYYAAGGGGGTYGPTGSVTAQGGSSIGGNGAVGGNTAGTPTANTGSGGGGAGGAGGGVNGTPTAGADGVVIIRTESTASATTGSPTVTTDGTYNIYKFTASGTITF